MSTDETRHTTEQVALVADVVRFRKQYVDTYVERRINHRQGDFNHNDLEAWERTAHERWRSEYPAFTVLLRSHLPTPAEIEDGFGGYWVTCGDGCDLQVVRPGEVQCNAMADACPDRSTPSGTEGSDG